MLEERELLQEPRINQWLAEHPDTCERANHACHSLCGRADAVAAMLKVLPALAERQVHVFFSYKAKDERAASIIVRLLRKYAAGKLAISYMADFGNITGRRWRDKIKAEVCQANWFILLLPDPSDDWDWCLFETGLFERKANSADRLICIHHPETAIPDPIKDYHAVPAVQTEVEKFLRMVYVDDDPIPGLPAINPDVNDDIPAMAREIVHAISLPTRALVRRTYEPWIQLALEDTPTLHSVADLDGARILNANEEALRLFDFDTRPTHWGELRRFVNGGSDDRWLKELFEAIRKIYKGRPPDSVQAVFPDHKGKFYRPSVCAVERLGERGPIHSFHITFVEDVSSIDSTNMPEELAALATVFRFSFRFRWEILEKYGRDEITPADVAVLDVTLRRLQSEWESRGMGGSAGILCLLPDDRHIQVMDMMVAWDKVRNPKGTGTLDRAIAARDPVAVREILAEFLPVNQAFLELLSDRFTELVAGRGPEPAA